MIYEKEVRKRKWLLTINNPEDKGISHNSIKQALQPFMLNYYAIVDETGSQGTYHYHIYIFFKNAIRFSSLKKLFPTANIQQAMGNSVQNRTYLLKSAPEHNKQPDGKYEYKDNSGTVHKGINHTDTFEEFGECPIEIRGKRNDLERMYELIKEGYSNSEIIESCGKTAILHVEKLNKLRHSYLIDHYKGTRRLNLKVHYISGKTGLGKSRDILDEFGDENVYRVTDYQHPFDSYQNENVLVFEEFRSLIRLSDMLNYLDIYPCVLPARYSPKVACYDTVFIVSNWEFESQYYELQQDPVQISTYEAFKRRINGYVKIYTENGIITYDSLDEYLQRDKGFYRISEEQEKDIPFIN